MRLYPRKSQRALAGPYSKSTNMKKEGLEGREKETTEQSACTFLEGTLDRKNSHPTPSQPKKLKFSQLYTPVYYSHIRSCLKKKEKAQMLLSGCCTIQMTIHHFQMIFSFQNQDSSYLIMKLADPQKPMPEKYMYFIDVLNTQKTLCNNFYDLRCYRF